jgi:hypothetical protein
VWVEDCWELSSLPSVPHVVVSACVCIVSRHPAPVAVWWLSLRRRNVCVTAFGGADYYFFLPMRITLSETE